MSSSSSTKKDKISSVVRKKLRDEKLRDDSFGRALKLFDCTPRPLNPDDYKSTSIWEYEESQFYKKLKQRMSLEKPPPELCTRCRGVHSTWDICPGDSCSVCYSNRHYHFSCPFFRELPKGAEFDRARFTVYCRCGCPFFDTDEWVCRAGYCVSTKARLKSKECEICGAMGEHTTYECTEAEVLVPQHKLLDQMVYELKPSKRSKIA